MSDAPSAVMDGKRSWAWRGGRVLLFAIHGSRIIWRRAARPWTYAEGLSELCRSWVN